MKYALCLADDGRILSVTFAKYAPAEATVADTLPEGDVSEYLYIAGEFVYAPKPDTQTKEEPTQLDRIEAQLAYTAMMTDTLLEV